MRVFLGTLGCRLNESEIESIGRAFKMRGHLLVDRAEAADLCVLNSCAVTAEAERKSRQLVKRMHRQAPAAEIVVTGCYSELHPDKVLALPGVRRVVENRAKEQLVQRLLGEPEDASFDLEPLARYARPGEIRRTRAFVKVQDGCDNQCTFCITTVARGAGRSRPIRQVVNEIKALVGVGYVEAVISGVHLGSYGRDLEAACDLKQLIEAILEQTSLRRLRLSSLEPWDIPAGFFQLWRDPRLCGHLHMPLQAGCDDTLRRMARRTRKSSYRALVDEARACAPGLSLTSDIIVGFPGETEAAFEESLAYVEELDFAHLHVFRYSPRPGTLAAGFSDQVEARDKVRRSRLMHALSEAGRRRFHAAHLGAVAEVLFEQSPREGSWQGLSANNLRVAVDCGAELHNRVARVGLREQCEDGTLRGELCSVGEETGSSGLFETKKR